jgi:hypothetical protein
MSVGIDLEDEPEVADVDLTQELTTGGRGVLFRGSYGSLAERILEVERVGGWRLTEQMLADEKINSSVNSIKQGVLSRGMQINAQVLVEPDESVAEVRDPDLEQAIEIEDYCQRCWVGMKAPNSAIVLDRFLDAVAFRTVLAEQVYRIPESGPDKGEYVLDRIKPKHPSSWELVLDAFDNVVGVRAPTIERYQGEILPREKFVILAFMPRHYSPLGQGVLTQAYNAWSMKVQVFPLVWKYMQLFAVPSIDFEMPEKVQERKLKDADGKPVGKLLSPADYYRKQMEGFLTSGGRVLVRPNGSTLKTLDPAGQGEGEVFTNVLKLLDDAIVHAILGSARASLEASQSSRKDAEASQDMMELVISYAKWALASAIAEDVFRPLVLYRYGPEVASRFTPEVSFGLTQMADFSRNANAVARLAQAKVLGPQHEGLIFRFLGFGASWRRKAGRAAVPPRQVRVVNPAQRVA